MLSESDYVLKLSSVSNMYIILIATDQKLLPYIHGVVNASCDACNRTFAVKQLDAVSSVAVLSANSFRVTGYRI
jgi:hypothetical protein